MATWAQAWEAVQMDSKGARREDWHNEFWVAAEGPGCWAYLFEGYAQLSPYQPTVEDVAATDWVIFKGE